MSSRPECNTTIYAERGSKGNKALITGLYLREQIVHCGVKQVMCIKMFVVKFDRYDFFPL